MSCQDRRSISLAVLARLDARLVYQSLCASGCVWRTCGLSVVRTLLPHPQLMVVVRWSSRHCQGRAAANWLMVLKHLPGRSLTQWLLDFHQRKTTQGLGSSEKYNLGLQSHRSRLACEVHTTIFLVRWTTIRVITADAVGC
jgi:hypothetical protein